MKNIIKITAITAMFALAACAGTLTSKYEGLSGLECEAAGGVMKEKGSGHFSGATFLTCVSKDQYPQRS